MTVGPVEFLPAFRDPAVIVDDLSVIDDDAGRIDVIIFFFDLAGHDADTIPFCPFPDLCDLFGSLCYSHL